MGTIHHRYSSGDIQYEEMEWEEHANVLIDMEVDPLDWLKMKRSRDRIIRLRRASCQRSTWRRLQKEKEDCLRELVSFREWLKEWGRSILMPLPSFQGMTVTTGVGTLWENGHLKESGRVQERGKMISWTMEMVTITAMEQLKLERKELSNYLIEEIMTELHTEIDTRERMKRFATEED